MNHPIEPLDSVVLRVDRPDLGLTVGEVGAVVEVLSDDAFEVEFVDAAGETYGLHTLTRADLIPVRQRGRAWRAQTGVA